MKYQIFVETKNKVVKGVATNNPIEALRAFRTAGLNKNSYEVVFHEVNHNNCTVWSDTLCYAVVMIKGTTAHLVFHTNCSDKDIKDVIDYTIANYKNYYESLIVYDFKNDNFPYAWERE